MIELTLAELSSSAFTVMTLCGICTTDACSRTKPLPDARGLGSTRSNFPRVSEKSSCEQNMAWRMEHRQSPLLALGLLC